jgi:hypothetical protein
VIFHLTAPSGSRHQSATPRNPRDSANLDPVRAGRCGWVGVGGLPSVRRPCRPRSRRPHPPLPAALVEAPFSPSAGCPHPRSRVSRKGGELTVRTSAPSPSCLRRRSTGSAARNTLAPSATLNTRNDGRRREWLRTSRLVRSRYEGRRHAHAARCSPIQVRCGQPHYDRAQQGSLATLSAALPPPPRKGPRLHAVPPRNL